MRAKEFLAEITRRDFLRGVGAAAGSAVVGKPRAQTTADVEDILSDTAYLSLYLNRYYPSDPRTKKLNDLIGQVLHKNIEYKLMYKDLYASAQTGVKLDPTLNQPETKEFVGKILQKYTQIIQGLEWLSSIETESKVRLREFAPSPERDDHDGVPDPIFVLANRWWNATDKQPQIEHVLNSLGWSIHQVESEDDAVQLQHRNGTTHYISADEFDPDLFEYKDTNDDQTAHRDGLDLESIQVGRDFQVTASSHGRELAMVMFQKYGDTLIPQNLEVGEQYRGQGIAAVMYDWVKELGYKIQRSPDQSPAGKRFWDKHRGEEGMIWESELDEIARIPQGDFGDKDTLAPMANPPKTRPLPGGSRFSYAVNKKDPEFMEIMIFDGDALVAELDLGATLDPLKTWQVETVATDPDYRGQGLGKALYGIALTILKLTLEAGETQTKHGQAMWLMLNSIPGVEVMGYAMDRTAEYRARPGDQVVDQNDTWTRYTFPVEPGKRSMRSTRPGTGIYSSQHVSMIARWTGQ
jgi:GNAT superfamily N-acetyltransferase